MTKDKVLELHAEVYKALANPKRLQILQCLIDGEKSVGEILACKQFLDTPQPTVSQHLALLRQAGLVTVRRGGTNVFYKLGSPKLVRALELTKEILTERLGELQKIATQI